MASTTPKSSSIHFVPPSNADNTPAPGNMATKALGVLSSLRQSYILRGRPSSPTSVLLDPNDSSITTGINHAKRSTTRIKFPVDYGSKYGDDVFYECYYYGGGGYYENSYPAYYEEERENCQFYPPPPPQPPGKVVKFASHVSVVEIPNRRCYTPTTSDRMWNNRKQLRRMAARNTVEYAYERFDWRHALEEDRFVRVGGAEGELVHPAHFNRRGNSSKKQTPQKDAANRDRSSSSPPSSPALLIRPGTPFAGASTNQPPNLGQSENCQHRVVGQESG